MRYLVVSDIHGNAAALEAVLAEPHDAVLCLGDLVGYGPEPGACVRWAMTERPLLVQGNHDFALESGGDPKCRPDFRWLADATRAIAESQLGAAERAFLRDTPRWLFATLDSTVARCVHATPSNTLYRYLGPDPEQWREELAGIPANLVLAGHTHLQFELETAGVRLVNPGSVGQPKDGDPHAAYAVIDAGMIELKRATYPIERTVDGLERAGIASEAVAVLGTLLRTGRSRP